MDFSSQRLVNGAAYLSADMVMLNVDFWVKIILFDFKMIVNGCKIH